MSYKQYFALHIHFKVKSQISNIYIYFILNITDIGHILFHNEVKKELTSRCKQGIFQRPEVDDNLLIDYNWPYCWYQKKFWL